MFCVLSDWLCARLISPQSAQSVLHFLCHQCWTWLWWIFLGWRRCQWATSQQTLSTRSKKCSCSSSPRTTASFWPFPPPTLTLPTLTLWRSPKRSTHKVSVLDTFTCILYNSPMKTCRPGSTTEHQAQTKETQHNYRETQSNYRETQNNYIKT